MFGGLSKRLKQRVAEKKFSLTKYHEIKKNAFDYHQFKT